MPGVYVPYHVTLHFAALLCRATRKMRLVWPENERAGLAASDTALLWPSESGEYILTDRPKNHDTIVPLSHSCSSLL